MLLSILPLGFNYTLAMRSHQLYPTHGTNEVDYCRPKLYIAVLAAASRCCHPTLISVPRLRQHAIVSFRSWPQINSIISVHCSHLYQSLPRCQDQPELPCDRTTSLNDRLNFWGVGALFISIFPCLTTRVFKHPCGK